MSALEYRGPEADVVQLMVTSPNAPSVAISSWTKYRFNQHFETPADAFSFTVADHELEEEARRALVPGMEVQLRVNGLLQCTGYIDDVTRDASRNGGVEWTIEGRDVFGPVVDSHIDPRTQFNKDGSLKDLLEQVFSGWGFVAYDFDSEADHKIRMGRPKGKPGSGTGTGRRGKQRGAKKIQQLRPNQHEGAFQFVSKIVQRHGLWLWPSADGGTVICDQPDYEQPAMHLLYRTAEQSNILSGSVHWSVKDQPSIIIADGESHGQEFGHSKLRAKAVHPYVGIADTGEMHPDVKDVWDKYPDAEPVDLRDLAPLRIIDGVSMRMPKVLYARPLYLHDETSRTQEELKSFLTREIALRVRRIVTVTYTVEGHGQYDQGGAFVPYGIDTNIAVRDDVGGLNGVMWCISRTFEKSRTGGTTTQLELIIPGSLQFHEPSA